MLIVGAQLLQAAQISLAGGDRGLLDLEAVLADRFGPRVAQMFLVGFLATTFSSILGVWQGVSLLFAAFVRNMRGTHAARSEERRVGTACVSTGRSRWLSAHYKKKHPQPHESNSEYIIESCSRATCKTQTITM